MIDNLGAGSSQAGQSSVVTNQSTIGQEEFLKILLTQLTYQDPLKPLDNQEFIAQMAQFTNLEQTRQLSANTDTLLTVQSATQAIELIGKIVTVSTDTGSSVGQVTTVSFAQGTPQLSVQVSATSTLTNVSLGDIQSVRN